MYSGVYDWGSGGLRDQGSYGHWWSTAAYSASNAYNLSMYSSFLYPQVNNPKADGFALRCVSYSTSARRYPLSYVYSGFYFWSDGNLNRQDSRGFWWSTTASNDIGAYYLDVRSSNLSPQINDTKAYGFTLRSTIARRYPLSYVFSGQWYQFNEPSLKLYYQGSEAVFWTTTADSDTHTYRVRINSGLLLPQDIDVKTSGFPLH